MSFASNIQAVSQRLLSTYGQSITFTRDTEIPYDVDTGECVTAGISSFTGYGNPGAFSAQEMEKATILDTDIKMYFYSTTLPIVGDNVEWNEIGYRIQKVDSISAQGQDCLYILQLRVG